MWQAANGVNSKPKPHQTNTTGNLQYAVCQYIEHTANVMFVVCPSKKLTAKIQHTAKKYYLTCVEFLTHGKNFTHGKEALFAVCLIFCTRQNFYTRQFFFKKVNSALLIFSAIHIQCIVLLVKFWYIYLFFAIFSYLISLIEFLGLNWKCFE